MDGIDERLRQLGEAARKAAATDDLDEALRLLVDTAVAVTGARSARLELDGADGDERVIEVGGPGSAGSDCGRLEAPLPAASRDRGRLVIDDGGSALGRTEQELAAAVAGLAGVVVESARLRERVRDRERWLDAVHEITSALIGGRRLDEVLRSTTRHTRTLVGADLATVAVPRASGSLVLRAADGSRADALEGVTFPHAGSISGAVIDSGEPLRIEDVTGDPRAAQPVVRLEIFGPALFVPLAAHGRSFGTLLVANHRGGRRFEKADLEAVVRIASHASLAVEYARSLEQIQRLGLFEERERIGRELHESVIQRVFDTSLSIEDVAMRLEADAPDLARRLTRAVDQLDGVARDIRTAVFPPPDADR